MSRKQHRRSSLCGSCHTRPAYFIYRGRVHRDANHDLCPQCWRAIVDRLRCA